jgi:hypothetical protein
MNTLGLAQECVPSGEHEATQRIIALLKQRLEREYPRPQRMLRDAHPKQHGLVRAEFIVTPNLPEDLRVGLFARPMTYPAWVRFSNMSDPPRPDIDPDSRGMAIKVMGVEGEKMLDTEKCAQTQDFVLMSTDFFVTRGVAEFADLVEALEGGWTSLMLHFTLHPRLLLLFMRARSRCASVLEIPYGSTTPYLFGTRAVKYSVRPTAPPSSTFPRAPSPDYLREQMATRLRHHEMCFDFLVQYQTDARTMPIEDPRVVWSEAASPPKKIATLRIPPQDFDTPARHEYGDNLAFTPWHCLPQHRPLGGINRGRRAIYETMSRFRQERNSVKREEPSGWNEL